MSTPSLVMIPCGYKGGSPKGKLYSVLPTDGSGDFDSTRASKKHKINSDLKLEIIENNVPALNYDAIGGCPVLNTEPQATNLITYPISFANTYWTKSGATIEGDPVTGVDIVSGWDFTSGWVALSATITSANTYTSNGTVGVINKDYSLQANTTYKAVFNGTVSSGDIRLVDGYNATYKSGFGEIVFQTGAYVLGKTNKIGFLSTVNGAVIEITEFTLVEIQGFSAPSVDFPTSAFKLVEDTSTASHRISSAQSLANNTYSVYAKADERSWILLTSTDTSSPEVRGQFFDIANGVIGVGGDATINAKIEALSDGWYRCSIDEGTNPSTRYAVMLATGDGTYSYTGDGTSGVYIFMAQVETGSVATSPTFTDITLAAEGSTTTRLADAVNRTGISSIIGQTEGTVVINTTNFLSSGSRTLALLYASGASYYQIYLTALNEVRIDVSGVFLFLGGTLVSGTQSKIAFAYKSGDFALYIDGVQIATSVSATIPASLNDLYVGNSLGGEQVGDIGSFSLYDTRLSNAELITLTT